MITKRHVGAIRSIQSVKALVSEKPVHLIMTAGYGFLQRPGYDAPSRGENGLYSMWNSHCDTVSLVHYIALFTIVAHLKHVKKPQHSHYIV